MIFLPDDKICFEIPYYPSKYLLPDTFLLFCYSYSFACGKNQNFYLRLQNGLSRGDTYSDCFKKYKNSFNICYENTVSNGIPEPELKRKIEILKVNDYQGNYSLEIAMELNDEKLNLRFEIEKFDFDNTKEILSELKLNEKLEFKGSYLGGKEISSLGIILKTLDKEIDLTIDSSKRIISNLIWFQELEDRKEIEKLIIKKAHNKG